MEIMFKVTNLGTNEIRRVNLIRVDNLFGVLSSNIVELFQLSNSETDSMQLMYRDCSNDLITFSTESELEFALREFSNSSFSSSNAPRAFPVFLQIRRENQNTRISTSTNRRQQTELKPDNARVSACDVMLEDPKLHKWVTCDGCQSQEVRGNRFKCDECDDYDLCETCFSSGAVHTHHNMRVIRGDTAAKQRAQRITQQRLLQEGQHVEIDVDKQFCEEIARKIAEFQRERRRNKENTPIESTNQNEAARDRNKKEEEEEERDLSANYLAIRNSLEALAFESVTSSSIVCEGGNAMEEERKEEEMAADPDFVHVFSDHAGSRNLDQVGAKDLENEDEKVNGDMERVEGETMANQNSIAPTQVLGVYNTLINMGFTNERDWLIAVIKQNNGDFNKILNFMEESNRNSRH